MNEPVRSGAREPDRIGTIQTAGASGQPMPSMTDSSTSMLE